MAEWLVTFPIAAHASIVVEADSETEAIDKAMDEISLREIDDWEPLKKVNSGNVCHFPSPWEVEAQEQ